ncbi:GNAT family N-acetyltransferase [Rufibacter roseus]|uniref:GNAT family N-acetyltransferase n=1 Tax=Rufibacter roseus TaxID=1567108 RepID=A0ABW2DLE2_9BACT|nr:GNAT family N-acetyltransferase [Rufibacter roseus]
MAAALAYRNAIISDLPKVVEIYNSSVASGMVTADTEPVTVQSRYAWFEAHNPETRPLWLVIEDDETVGWVSFQSFYDRPAYNATAEINIYLCPEKQNSGLGKQILQYAINMAPQLGIKTLIGYIFAHNEPTLRLFRSFWFEDWGTLPNIAMIEGEERTLKILGKRILP